MTVEALIAKLREFPSDAIVTLPPDEGGWQADIDDAYADERTVGILNPEPRRERIVVLGTGMEGL